MLVAPTALFGTIGGGALEHMVVLRARQALRDAAAGRARRAARARDRAMLRRPRGGGAESADAGAGRGARRAAAGDRGAWPHVYVFGSGHVGKALARALVPLPLNLHVIDTRPDGARSARGGGGQAVPMPEAVVRAAPGSGYAILTHDHALDFLIAAGAQAGRLALCGDGGQPHQSGRGSRAGIGPRGQRGGAGAAGAADRGAGARRQAAGSDCRFGRGGNYGQDGPGEAFDMHMTETTPGRR